MAMGMVRYGSIAAAALLASACVGPTDSSGAESSPGGVFILADTHWQLVEIASPAEGSEDLRSDPEPLYTMLVNADGSVAFRLDCNRGIGRWEGSNLDSGQNGLLSFSQIGVTRALCHPDSISDRVESDLSKFRTFSIDGEELSFSTDGDAATYLWVPFEGES